MATLNMKHFKNNKLAKKTKTNVIRVQETNLQFDFWKFRVVVLQSTDFIQNSFTASQPRDGISSASS